MSAECGMNLKLISVFKFVHGVISTCKGHN